MALQNNPNSGLTGAAESIYAAADNNGAQFASNL